MGSSPKLKVYNPSGTYVASCKHGEDAACLAALYGDGAEIRYGHSLVVWKEGVEAFGAGVSYDGVDNVITSRILDAHVEGLKRAGWSDERINAHIKA